jgi:hypothetical protein
MSWTQGITERKDLPESFVKWADGKGNGALEYITWFAENPREVFLDYGERGSIKVTFKQSLFV